MIDKFVSNLINVILLPLFNFGVALAVLYFIWGVFQFLMKTSKGEPAKDEKVHMLSGLIGIFVMISAVAIIKIITNTLGIDSSPVDVVPFYVQ